MTTQDRISLMSIAQQSLHSYRIFYYDEPTAEFYLNNYLKIIKILSRDE